MDDADVRYIADAIPDVHEVAAEWSFIGRDSSELCFEAGETLSIVGSESIDWLLAENFSGKRGYVPATYVRRQKRVVSLGEVGAPEGLDATGKGDTASTVSSNSFTTVAPSLAARSQVAAAASIGRRLSQGALRDWQSAQGDVVGLASNLRAMRMNAAEPSEAPNTRVDDAATTIGPWDSVSCIGDRRPAPDELHSVIEGDSPLQVTAALVTHHPNRTVQPIIPTEESVVSSVAPTVAPSMLAPAASVAAVPLVVHVTPTKPPAVQPQGSGNSVGGSGTPSRGIRLMAASGGPKPKMIKIVRPASYEQLLKVANTKAAQLWPGESGAAVATLIDEDGCEVDADNFELIEEGALLTVERAG